MDTEKYTQLLNNDVNIQKIAFATMLFRENIDIPKIEDIIKQYDFADELLELHSILLYMREINKYNVEWATKTKEKMYNIKIDLTKDANFKEKLEIINTHKILNEDLDYLIGNRSMPNVRNIKRMTALNLILSGKSYEEIVNSIK